MNLEATFGLVFSIVLYPFTGPSLPPLPFLALNLCNACGMPVLLTNLSSNNAVVVVVVVDGVPTLRGLI